MNVNGLKADFRAKQIAFADEFTDHTYDPSCRVRRMLLGYTAWEYGMWDYTTRWCPPNTKRLFADAVKAARLYCVAKREGLNAAMLYKLRDYPLTTRRTG